MSDAQTASGLNASYETGSMTRAPGLDLLRAVAILWVMWHHAMAIHLGSSQSDIARLGWMGVDIFFVLSGYLIGVQILTPYINGSKLNFGCFYIRRAYRIIPAYMATVIVYFAVPGLRETPEIQPLWQFVTFTENLFVHIEGGKSFSHVWSLCVEEHFYVVAPLIIWALMRRPSFRKALGVCICILVFGITVRSCIWLRDIAPLQGLPGDSDRIFQIYADNIYYPTWGRLDDLLTGIVLASVKVFRPLFWDKIMNYGNALLLFSFILIGLAVFSFSNRYALFPTAFGYPLLACGLLFLVAAGASQSSLIGQKPLFAAAPIATVSYSLYLSHKISYHFIQTRLNIPPDVGFLQAIVLYGGSAMSIGALLYWAVERPFLQMREGVTDKNARRAAPGSV